MPDLTNQFEGAQMIRGYDKEPTSSDDVLAHGAEAFEATEVICGVFDKELNNSDDVLAHTAELQETAGYCSCSIYNPDTLT
jgi:hypothetical protein